MTLEALMNEKTAAILSSLCNEIEDLEDTLGDDYRISGSTRCNHIRKEVEAMIMSIPTGEEEVSDTDYLLDLAERIFRIPPDYDVDQGDHFRLREIAEKIGSS
jgi:hypothetical protein